MSGQMILATGRRAENPYYMERFYVNLYSVEELCFLFVDRAELLDAEIMQRSFTSVGFPVYDNDDNTNQPFVVH